MNRNRPSPRLRIASRLVIAVLLAGYAIRARAIVFTTEYDGVVILPKLTGNPPDQDWRAHGAVTPVKNEGACDSSWAFAATGLVEGDHVIRTGMPLLNLSEQELLDCTDTGSSCAGGSPVGALRLVIARGLTNTAAYPYTARVGTCKAFTKVATIPGAGSVPPGDEVSLQGYVAKGPVLALIDDSDPSFDSYRGGVFAGPCGDNPTRAVLIVGFITNGTGGQDYWIVKNSRGTSWGSQGYIFMVRHKNICGIANFALAVSNDQLPPPSPLLVPTLSGWALGVLLLGLAAGGVLTLRRHVG